MIAVLVGLVLSCGPAPVQETPQCVQGRVQRCVLESGENGRQTCEIGGVYGACEPLPHPSGAPAVDVTVMRWLGRTAEVHRQSMYRACEALGPCQQYREGLDDATTAPEARACLEERLPRCIAAIAAARAVSGPTAGLTFLRQLADEQAAGACEFEAHLAVWRAVPDLATRLRFNRRERSWEYLSQWAERNEGLPAVQAYRTKMRSCVAQMENRFRAYGEISRWLRQRFYCEPIGCCTIERVATLLDRGEEPGPPRPQCL